MRLGGSAGAEVVAGALDRGPAEAPEQFVRRYPIGAEVLPGGGVHFRVWSPRSREVCLEWVGGQNEYGAGVVGKGGLAGQGEKAMPLVVNLERQTGGYHSGLVKEASPGTLYRYRLEHGSFPDPASRFQPQGVEGLSEVVASDWVGWSDQEWGGVKEPERQVIYEMHIGTFTREGTWAAAEKELEELARLGITILEVMPVAEFAGRFGWGYDGVDLFAPYHGYGRPEAMRSFVNAAHRLGMAVILDVVYNHLGPRGNFLKEFSADYFSKKYKNEWGEPINFDGENSGPVREFFLTNAAYWVEEYHLDGLRLDATQQMYDSSPNHIVGALTRRAREAGGSRKVYLVAENEPQEARLVQPFEKGGHGMDGVWSDDFHHAARVAATGRNEAYYSPYRGTAQELVSTAKHGFLYQGQYYSWQKTRRGTVTRGLPAARFVKYLQNHDQVANSLDGLRLHQLTSPGRYRALTALLLLGPGTPMLFQGQEYAADTPFLYFADHNGELGEQVAQGRKEFLRQFPSIASEEAQGRLADPQLEETFARCKLDPGGRAAYGPVYQLHCDLLKLRREDQVLAAGRVDGAVLSDDAFVLRYFGEENEGDRLLIVNLGRGLHLLPAPEPLLAPFEGGGWRLVWSSESPEYGGGGTPELDTRENWRVPAEAAVVLASS